MSFKIGRPLGLLTIVAAVGMLVAAQSASAANIIRPNGATPIGASLVIAYAPCTSGGTPTGEVHNPANLPGAACTPPVKFSPRLTAGDPLLNGAAANFKGNVKLVVTLGSPDDVLFPSGAPKNNYVQDVRCESGYAGGLGAAVCGTANANANPDYTGALNIVAYIRITDRNNSGLAGTCNISNTSGCTDAATVADQAFAVAADCSTTASTAIGSTCLPRFASANALCGCTSSTKTANIEIGVGPTTNSGGIFATDGGNDGVVPNLAPDTDGPAPYARMGLFLP